MTKKHIANLAFRFVLIIGIVNLFADFTYEGGRSVMGAFLGTLGASGTIVGFVAGFGELMGYGLRSITGFIGDKTHKYWLMTLFGYFINLFAVPALALAGNWPTAAALMILERTGRAIRKPNIDTMLAYTTKEMGRGWVFGFNEALDQTGATIGPLIVALVLYLKGGYRYGFAVLLISAVLCFVTLILARILYPRPQDLEKKEAIPLRTKGFSSAYWFSVIAGACIAAGFVDFSLISFHFQKTHIISSHIIPIYYAVAMATGAITALLFGKLLDKIGFPSVFIAFFISSLFAPFIFLGNSLFALFGMILWGAGIGAQDSLLKSILVPIIPANKRSTGFGVFDTSYGIFWFLGSATIGVLYDKSIPALIFFSVLLQLIALPIFFLAERESKQKK
ncbi:MAG TPA: MFS transporter [Patescibacteria group bacterium]|nr:MFS transporter [Patescibacteria group bacterium]